MSSEPLDFIEIIEMNNGDDPTIHTIKLSEITAEGLIIGRDKKRCDIYVGDKLNGSTVFDMLSRKHAVLYKHDNDYYLRRGYRDNNGGWVTPKEGSGFDIFVAGRPTERGKAIQLRFGALVDLVPKIGDYQCKLHWAVKASESQPPTIPVDDDKVNQALFENRILKEQSQVKELQLKELQDVNARITEIVAKNEQVAKSLRDGLEVERQINKRQDKKLDKLKIYGVVMIVLVIIALGVDIEEVERIAEIGALLAGGGMFYTASKG